MRIQVVVAEPVVGGTEDDGDEEEGDGREEGGEELTSAWYSWRGSRPPSQRSDTYSEEEASSAGPEVHDGVQKGEQSDGAKGGGKGDNDEGAGRMATSWDPWSECVAGVSNQPEGVAGG